MVRQITFFAKHKLINEDVSRSSGKFLTRVSTVVRAEEMAEYLGAKLNPAGGYENDVCIYIKPRRLVHIKDGAYVDVLDDPVITEKVKTRPKIKVISMSTPHHEYLTSILKNEVIYIPHHHVNFENIRRDRKEIINCGYVGVNQVRHIQINQQVKERLAEIGLNFIPLFNYTTREDIINYYKRIDLQIIGYFDHLKNTPWYHPTKIINAMSFGIPTIAGYKLGYRDVENFYIPVSNMDELVKEAEKMKDPANYNLWPEKIIKEADKYHISKIAELYKQL